jgi:hypothetical protein
VKKSVEEKGLTRKRKVREGRKEKRDFNFASLRALAPLREMFFPFRRFLHTFFRPGLFRL